ncbi:hypothetical protein F4820DRAFT_405040 [Hypoxylon rubiginosum]|uniref:Uncharacterized protein n=1 Tax=Hypoxylon rubiginosum TaxID=110542 RepID=A0ACB9ZE30_9PEZI|nr:hypothetical protein F4820DRAFT_405040 [Hypoxylon rubiginosum]
MLCCESDCLTADFTSPLATTKMSKPWTDGEQICFLNQVINHLLSQGGHVKYDKLNMPGRTPKSLSHAMEKVRAQGAAYQKQTGQPVTTPKGSRKGATAAPKTPPTTPTRATRKHPSPRRDDSDEDDDEEYKPGPRPKRQRRLVRRVKKEVVDSDADTIAAKKDSDTDNAGVNSDSESNAKDVKEEDGLDEA